MVIEGMVRSAAEAALAAAVGADAGAATST